MCPQFQHFMAWGARRDSGLLQRSAEVGLAAVDLEAGVGDFGGGFGKEEGATVEQGKQEEGGEQAAGFHQVY